MAALRHDLSGHCRPGLGFRMERARKVAKWLFIAPDITDWNTNGRARLLGGIRKALNEAKWLRSRRQIRF